MEVHEKIRVMREVNQWTQEDVAEKLGMSANGYSKIERGLSKPNLEKLQQIANIFNIDVIELIDTKDKGFTYIVGDNNSQTNSNNSHYSSDETLSAEIEKLKLIIKHKDELLAEKEREINTLNDLVQALKKQ